MTLRVAIAGLGYFSQFHVAAWHADPRVQIVGVCDTDADRREQGAAQTGAPGYHDAAEMAERVKPDVIDIVAPPVAHAKLVRGMLGQGRLIICQKPFCTSIAEAEAIIAEADAAGTRIVIHENFRFQPWYRQLHALLNDGDLGAVFQARFALRPGDGRGPDAYLARQPFFQAMERFLIHETGVHFIDTFRWLFGDITSVYAETRRLNPAIAGEDAGMVLLTHNSGARSTFDGNRLVDHAADNQRLTMGEMEIETEGGVLRLNGRGRITLRRFGSSEFNSIAANGVTDTTSFGGGCVAFLIAHVIDHLTKGTALENEARDYLHVMQVSDAAYQSAAQGRRISISSENKDI